MKTSLDGNLLYDLNEQHQQLNVIYLSEPFMDQKDIGEVEVKWITGSSRYMRISLLQISLMQFFQNYY